MLPAAAPGTTSRPARSLKVEVTEVTGYRDVLVRLLADVDGIYRRHSEVLGRFEAVEDRMHAARREMEAIDATDAKTPADSGDSRPPHRRAGRPPEVRARQ
jgi:hypothetical protein